MAVVPPGGDIYPEHHGALEDLTVRICSWEQNWDMAGFPDQESSSSFCPSEDSRATPFYLPWFVSGQMLAVDKETSNSK